MRLALPPSASRLLPLLPLALCVAAIFAHLAMINLKGISTDEGIRLGIINGGHSYTPTPAAPWPGYPEVLHTLSPYAYQPAYYLLQNTLMRLAGRQDLLFFRLINVAFLAVCLSGLLVLTRAWTPGPRAFLIGLFGFNAYLIMHVLQIREYIVGVAFYIWSTWLVLQLDRRELAREWPDIGWFLGYGLLLTLGFYVQTWTVFPAIAQGAFLVLRRRPQLVRFFAHLGLSYMIVFTLTWPYLRANTQKINVGLWSPGHVSLADQVSNGFHLVLSGHLAHAHWFTSLLPIAWLSLLAAAGVMLWRQRTALRPEFVAEAARQGWLMIACIAVPLAFQIAYFYKVEPLSVWPRYFVIHYFFLTWLIAQAFRTLVEARSLPQWRLQLTGVLAGACVLLAASVGYQIRSYWQDPYFDTGTSAVSNWNNLSAAVRRLVQPDDVIFTYDFVTRSTLTATHPLPNRVLQLSDLDTAVLEPATRLIYLESSALRTGRADLEQRMAARGYGHLADLSVPAGDGSGPVSDWRILTFSRP